MRASGAFVTLIYVSLLEADIYDNIFSHIHT